MRLSDGELMQLLWDERDGELPDVGVAFAEYINEEFTPWDMLEVCENLHRRLKEDESGIMRSFFEDWLAELMQERPYIVEDISGWREMEPGIWENKEAEE